MTKETIGQRLAAMRKTTGLSLADVARLAGYSGASSVQAYFSVDYNPEGGMDLQVARRLAHALKGRGNPTIHENDVLRLAGVQINRDDSSPTSERPFLSQFFAGAPPSEITPPRTPTPTLRGQPKDVPVYGTTLASDLEADADGYGLQPIEQTTFDMGEVIGWVRRPPSLDPERKVYVVHVVGHSMEPRYRPGDPVFVDPVRPPAIGDDVIIQLAEPDADGGMRITCGLIKTLARRSASTIELEQYSPHVRFKLPTPRVASVHRIIPWREAFSM